MQRENATIRKSSHRNFLGCGLIVSFLFLASFMIFGIELCTEPGQSNNPPRPGDVLALPFAATLFVWPNYWFALLWWRLWTKRTKVHLGISFEEWGLVGSWLAISIALLLPEALALRSGPLPCLSLRHPYEPFHSMLMLMVFPGLNIFGGVIVVPILTVVGALAGSIARSLFLNFAAASGLLVIIATMGLLGAWFGMMSVLEFLPQGSLVRVFGAVTMLFGPLVVLGVIELRARAAPDA